MILCAAIYSLCTVEDVNAYQLFTYWECFEIARKAGFEIEFAFNRLRNATHAYLGLADTNCSDPNNKELDEEMKKKSKEMEKLHKTCRQHETFMLPLNPKDGSIEIVGKNSWDESGEVMVEEEEEEEEDPSSNTNEITQEEEEEEEEEDKEEDEDEEEGEEETGENLWEGEEEEDTTKVDEEKSSEMPEPRELKQAQTKPPNPWDCNDTSKQTESSNLGEQEGQTAILKDLEKIRYFNEKQQSSKKVTCFYCKQRMSKEVNREDQRDPQMRSSTSNDPNKVVNYHCTACHFPILTENIKETYHCSRCKIFLHKFCVKYPPEIQHPLHPLHHLKRGDPDERVGNNIKCNVCGEKCRGSAYYFCKLKGCKFYLEVQCLFREPTFQSRCHGKVFRLSEKRTIKQNPRRCFACGEKISNGSSSSTDFLRCVPCNVNLHVKCPIPSRIIRSFHPHPLYFNVRVLRGKCEFCKEKMKPSYPAYSCMECRGNFHIDCATSNLVDDVDTHGSHQKDRELQCQTAAGNSPPMLAPDLTSLE